MKPIKTHTFNGKIYDIDITGAIDGATDSPNIGTKPSLILCTNLNTMNGVITVVHEALHACHFIKSEDSVEQTANDIGRFIWRLYNLKTKN